MSLVFLWELLARSLGATKAVERLENLQPGLWGVQKIFILGIEKKRRRSSTLWNLLWRPWPPSEGLQNLAKKTAN